MRGEGEMRGEGTIMLFSFSTGTVSKFSEMPHLSPSLCQL